MPTSTDVMATLNEQWYNAVTTQLGLDQSTFQLVQGSMALGSTSDAVFQIFDAIPPLSLTQQFNPSGFNSFSAAYAAVINNLVPQNNAGSLQNVLGDQYIAWVNYRKNPSNLPNPLPTDAQGNPDVTAAQVAMFSRWAIANLDAGTTKAGVTILQQTDAVSVAQAALLAAKGKYAYTSTIARVKAAILSGQAKTASFDSTQESSDTSHAWAGGKASGGYGFFKFSASGNWDKFNQQVEENGVKVSAQFQNVATVPGQPLQVAQPLDPDLSKYVPWFNSAALNLAFRNSNNRVWQQASPTWNDTFGTSGNLQRLAVGLIVVDGIQTTVTVNYSLTTEDKQSVEGALKFGFFPFFTASGSGGWTHEITNSDTRSFTLTSSSPAGNPQILGVLVSPIDAVLGS